MEDVQVHTPCEVVLMVPGDVRGLDRAPEGGSPGQWGDGSLGVMVLSSLAQNDARGLASAWTEMGRATPFADLLGFQEDMTRLVPLITAACLPSWRRAWRSGGYAG
ncbi:hypothetical protein ACFYXC_14570 [Streptomyces sp. NPDC002701]|uniref:hypothetical protein n=1 Tax=Streptomyces sp. NPDC002701 TaxID=3364661 RepID=UPI0036993849